MLISRDATNVDPSVVESTKFDVVIVGSGIAGSIIAKQMAQNGNSVLVLEAGVGEQYDQYLQRFYATASKDNQSPYALNPDAPTPRSTDAHKIHPGRPDSSAYLVQTGPFGSDTTYTRVLGGTTMHWEGKVIRMLPEDFGMMRNYGQGLDWPFDYDELEPYYCDAEREIGVSADLEDCKYLGTRFKDGYVFPMRGLPLSYLDRQVDAGICGTSVELYGERYELKVRPFPQGRNGIPNADYSYGGERGFTPVTAVSDHQSEEGGRCQGNNACVPLCPVQAKYNAGKTLAAATQTGKVRVIKQAVASRVLIDGCGRVSGIEFKHYKHPDSPEHKVYIGKGTIYVLAANAIENPRLMLASGLGSRSGLMGRNLMDHAYLLSWALMPQICGTMRGTNCTGGIVELRGGAFRRHQAAFSVDIHNDGWGWAVGSPYSDLIELVDNQNKYGSELRQALIDRVSRQLQLAFMIEALPNESNRVTVDPGYTDALGNMRPVLSYNIPDYVMRGAAYARQFAKLVFQRLGAGDYTAYDSSDYGYVPYEGEGYVIRGGNHLSGTHIMGSSASSSVVNDYQRSWEHDNLYLVGGGSMPTIGTANTTLTIAALCFRTAKAMRSQLGSVQSNAA
jgi:choline dehydrogenase-like flavoprotein